MQVINQIFRKYSPPNGQAPKNQFWQMVGEFYQARTGQIADPNQIPQIIQKNGMEMPTQYTIMDFATYAINFCMMMAYHSGKIDEYENLYALLIYSGFDPQGDGFVDSKYVVNQMISYYSQLYPGINQQVVNQVLIQNGVQPGAKINESKFIQIYRAVANMFKGQQPQPPKGQ